MHKPDTLNTMVFLDSGNPAETTHAVASLGFLDGQTTNPSLVAKNPHIQELKKSGSLTHESIWSEYQKVAQAIYEILPSGHISVEVYVDTETIYDDALAQARILATWLPGVFVKLPVTTIGLRVAEILVAEGINVNMTLCFSQEQAAAVHMATRGAKRGQVYVSPFIGRLDDIGMNGLDLIKNILEMYRAWDSHVMVLGASIRSLDHLFGCLQQNIDIITIPVSIVDAWVVYGIDKNPTEYVITENDKEPIPYVALEEKEWTNYNIQHDLTDKGIEKFSTDWKNLFV